jgi:hypothetical protein
MFNDMEILLEENLNLLIDQQVDLETCLGRITGQRDQIEPLLKLAVTLRQNQALTAPADFRENAVERLRARITPRGVPLAQPARSGLFKHSAPAQKTNSAARPWFHFGRFSAMPLLVTIVLLVVLASASIASAAHNSYPGQTLYPVKQALETARESLTPPGDEALRLHLELADERMQEMERLAGWQEMERIPPTMEEYRGQIHQALTQLETYSNLAALDETGRELADHKQRITRLIQAVAPTAPATQEKLTQLLRDLNQFNAGNTIPGLPADCQDLSCFLMPSSFPTTRPFPSPEPTVSPQWTGLPRLSATPDPKTILPAMTDSENDAEISDWKMQRTEMYEMKTEMKEMQTEMGDMESTWEPSDGNETPYTLPQTTEILQTLAPILTKIPDLKPILTDLPSHLPALPPNLPPIPFPNPFPNPFH